MQPRDIYNVTRLNREVRAVLDSGFGLIWLEGEISNLACPASGHWYFSLKDSHAQVRCAMFRTRNRLLRFVPRNGLQVVVRAKVGLYEPRGEFQILIEHMEEAGEGALKQQFEELKNKLNGLGLFASDRKKSLPSLAKRIGIITSPTGAAIHDVLTTLKRRFAALEVVIYPVSVQGKPAAKEIAKMIELANNRAECDALILTRGGGSLEDLWSFNEEVVAQAIFKSTIPLVSAIGHDIDFTIADFVADVRAATPTAAAELVSPDTSAWKDQISLLNRRLQQRITNTIQLNQQLVEHLAKRLIHPHRYIEEKIQRIDEIYDRLQRSIKSMLATTQLNVRNLESRCKLNNPLDKIKARQQHSKQLLQRLQSSQNKKIGQLQHRFSQSTATLDALSPLATLNRGYAYVTANKKLIKDVRKLKNGDSVNTKLANGHFDSTITNITIET